MIGEEEGKLTVPDWMGQGTMDYKQNIKSNGGSSKYLLKSIVQMRKALSEEMITERLARQPGLLQGVDPRVKLIGTISLILLVGMTRSICLLLVLWGLTLVLMYLSKLPVCSLEKRIWGIIPLWTPCGQVLLSAQSPIDPAAGGQQL